jgi:hypothetical protein
MLVHVTITESTEKVVQIEAKSLEEAIIIARDGGGNIVDISTSMEVIPQEIEIDPFDDDEEFDPDTPKVTAIEAESETVEA